MNPKLKEEIEKLEKGCICNKHTGEPCGIVGRSLKFNLCRDCREKLSQTNKILNIVKEIIDEMIKTEIPEEMNYPTIDENKAYNDGYYDGINELKNQLDGK